MWTRRIGFVLGLLIVGLALLVLTRWDTEEPVFAHAPVAKPNAASTIFLPFVSQTYTTTPAPLWRFGIDKLRRALTDYDTQDLAALRLSWYVDFGAAGAPITALGIDYLPMVRVKQWKKLANGTPTLCCVDCAYLTPYSYTVSLSTSQIQSLAASRPGMTWMIGNEMERIDWSGLNGTCAGQDEMLPEVYAQAYHDVYTTIKNADATAQVAIGALVQPSPLRLKYLDRVWAQYAISYTVNMPVDVWNIHVYVYNEQKGSWGADIPAGLTETVGTVYQIRDHKDFTKAATMIEGWRTWMKNHGQQNKPLITPEYGVVLPEWVQDPPGVTQFSPIQVRDSFMYPSFNYFLNQTNASLGYPADGNRLVQRWAWWSMDYDDGTCDPTDGLFYPDNNGNLFYSGMGPGSPPTNCPYPAQGISPLGAYWTQYVGALPAGAAKPYAPVQPPVAAPQVVASTPVLNVAPESAQCFASSQARARLLQALPSRATPAGQQAWVSALSKLTPGTRICAP
ncbi:MAG: hypothetical protein HY868_24210 [Chloroflexi bacterium]|nr:hypothetical protein [Chloroflexota bacterium]